MLRQNSEATQIYGHHRKEQRVGVGTVGNLHQLTQSESFKDFVDKYLFPEPGRVMIWCSVNIR